MALLPEIADFLHAHSLGTLGTDLFLSRLMEGNSPPTAMVLPSFVTALFETPGKGGHRTMDTPGIRYEQPGLQVIVRAEPDDYAGATAHAKAIHEVLATVVNMTLGGTWYVAIDPLHPPQDAGRDQHDRPLIMTRFIVTKEPS